MIIKKTTQSLFFFFSIYLLTKKIKPLTKLLNLLANKIYRNHPALAKRIEPIVGTVFLIKITDAPLNILLTIKEQDIVIRCISKKESVTSNLVILGKFMDLLKIFEGNKDGDALFFSRKLRVEGNMQPLVCLRNAIDNENINLTNEISSIFKHDFWAIPFHRSIINFYDTAK